MHSSFRRRHADRRRDKSRLSMQTVATVTCVLPLGVWRTVKCQANRNLCHFSLFVFIIGFCQLLLKHLHEHATAKNTRSTMLKWGRVSNLIIYIYLKNKTKKPNRSGRGLCIKVDWGGSEHGKPSNPGRSVNTMQ